MITGIFARQHHPCGYGGFGCSNPDHQTFHEQGPPWSKYTAAHGYVVVAVQCETATELILVENVMRKKFEWPGRNGDGWFDGSFDLVLAIEECGAFFGMDGRAVPLGSHISYGDNRAAAYIRAEDILDRLI